MLEEEAKTKWCPAYRVATSGGDPSSTYEMDNRPRDGIPPADPSDKDAPWAPGPNFNPYACCIGSACMAWRWARPSGIPDKIAAIKEHRRVNPSASLLDAKNAVEASWGPKGDGGRCGLAGSQ